MDIPEFVPTLAELIEADEPWSNQCCWRNQKKSKQNAIRCGNTVRGRDARERDGLIDFLRVLIPYSTETGTLGPVTPDSLTEIREELEKASMWLLCKGQHRSNSKKIVRKWCDELEGARDRPAPVDVRKELNIDKGKELLCHGRKQRDGTRCTEKISPPNRQFAYIIIADIARARDSSPTTKENILLLAEFLMCQGCQDQGQAIGKSQEWFKKIQKLFPPADASPGRPSRQDQPSTPRFSRTTILDSETPISATSSLFSRADSTAASTPSTSPPSQRRYTTRANTSESPSYSRSTRTTTTNVGNASIFPKWSDKLDNLEKARDQPVRNNIREELGIDEGEDLSCHAKEKDGTRCANKISAKNSQRACAIITDVAKARDSSPITKKDVLLLAHLLICQHSHHRDQVAGKSEEWFTKIQKLFPPADAVLEQPSTPHFGRATTADSETPKSTASGISSRAGSIATSTPSTSPPSQRPYTTRATASESPSRSKRTNTTTTTIEDEPPQAAYVRVTRRTTFERQAGLLTPEPVYPHFKPFPPKNCSVFLTDLYNLITRDFKGREVAPGYIYGFKRDGGDCIKVGFTNDLKRRMRQWSADCNQKVVVVLQKYVPHAGKLESVVHATLYNQRRRECLVNGACNNGRGCHKTHREWLEVALNLLEEVVDTWIRWFECIPYNERGCLKSEWVERISKLRKEQKVPLPDLWRKWIDVSRLAKGTTSKVKAEPVDDESMLVFDVKKNKKIVITTTEIKMEPDDDVPDFATLRRRYRQNIKMEPNDDAVDFRELGRRYRQRIEDLKH
jgi:T5orf172 domain